MNLMQLAGLGFLRGAVHVQQRWSSKFIRRLMVPGQLADTWSLWKVLPDVAGCFACLMNLTF